MRGDCCGLDLRAVVFEMRDILKEINQNISHLIEQNRTEKMLSRNREEE